jgi:hypothetical protein
MAGLAAATLLLCLCCCLRRLWNKARRQRWLAEVGADPGAAMRRKLQGIHGKGKGSGARGGRGAAGKAQPQLADAPMQAMGLGLGLGLGRGRGAQSPVHSPLHSPSALERGFQRGVLGVHRELAPLDQVGAGERGSGWEGGVSVLHTLCTALTFAGTRPA